MVGGLKMYIIKLIDWVIECIRDMKLQKCRFFFFSKVFAVEGECSKNYMPGNYGCSH